MLQCGKEAEAVQGVRPLAVLDLLGEVVGALGRRSRQQVSSMLEDERLSLQSEQHRDGMAQRQTVQVHAVLG